MAKASLEGGWQLAAAARYDINELAKLHTLSVRQLQRDFQRRLGRTPQDWLNEQRLHAARQLLLAGLPVKKVAVELGFKQSSHFCRHFKTYHLMTPSEFIQMHGGTNPPVPHFGQKPEPAIPWPAPAGLGVVPAAAPGLNHPLSPRDNSILLTAGGQVEMLDARNLIGSAINEFASEQQVNGRQLRSGITRRPGAGASY